MRISSRGTVSMGPVGWLIVGPFLLLFWLAYWTLFGLFFVLAALVKWLCTRDWGAMTRKDAR
jgi:hypothetical protein